MRIIVVLNMPGIDSRGTPSTLYPTAILTSSKVSRMSSLVKHMLQVVEFRGKDKIKKAAKGCVVNSRALPRVAIHHGAVLGYHDVEPPTPAGSSGRHTKLLTKLTQCFASFLQVKVWYC